MVLMHNLSNLTDELIDQLRNEALDADDSQTADLCRIALLSQPGPEYARRTGARIMIVAHLNAVAAMESS